MNFIGEIIIVYKKDKESTIRYSMKLDRARVNFQHKVHEESRPNFLKQFTNLKKVN